MDNLEPKKPASPENLVAEIVDQITEKQIRAARGQEPEPALQVTCSFCLEDVAAGTPYRVILKCVSVEPDSP